MVGVPGKSKGCNTCRRRKVKCDLAKPVCQRCTVLGKECEGYARYPVFIIRGQSGLERRKRLEEAKPTIPEYAFSQAKEAVQLVPSAKFAIETQILATFWESHTGSSYSGQSICPSWLYHAINIPSPSVALEKALLSVAYIRLGRLHNDPAMVVQGRRYYGRALGGIKTALYDSELIRDDQTLAGAMCMVLYESFETTSGDMVAWQNHVMGLAKIIQIRGPVHHHEPLARAILETARYLIMVVCLVRRECSIFGDTSWLTEPWQISPTDLTQRLYDYGFELAGLMEMVEQDGSRTDLRFVLGKITTGYLGLMELNENLLADGRAHELAGSEDAHDVAFGGTTFALTSCLISSIDLSYCIFASALLDQFPPIVLAQHQDLIDRIRGYLDLERRGALSREILRQLKICLSRNAFDYMRPGVIYPLNVVRWELRGYRSESAEIRALFDDIAASSQYRIARRVQNAGMAVLPKYVAERKGSGDHC